MSFDMGDTKWKMAFNYGNEKPYVMIKAGDH